MEILEIENEIRIFIGEKKEGMFPNKRKKIAQNSWEIVVLFKGRG